MTASHKQGAALSFFHLGQFPHDAGMWAMSLAGEGVVVVHVAGEAEQSVAVVWPEVSHAGGAIKEIRAFKRKAVAFAACHGGVRREFVEERDDKRMIDQGLKRSAESASFVFGDRFRFMV